jgi:hypothetical protein
LQVDLNLQGHDRPRAPQQQQQLWSAINAKDDELPQQQNTHKTLEPQFYSAKHRLLDGITATDASIKRLQEQRRFCSLTVSLLMALPGSLSNPNKLSSLDTMSFPTSLGGSLRRPPGRTMV